MSDVLRRIGVFVNGGGAQGTDFIVVMSAFNSSFVAFLFLDAGLFSSFRVKFFDNGL
jgi:hypothetical protein